MREGLKKLDQAYLTLGSQQGEARDVILPSYNRNEVGIGIVHLGLGAFHRSHQAMFTELLLNEEGSGDWGICGVSFRNKALKEQLDQQDCLYTTATLDSTDSFQVVGAIKEVLVVQTQLTDVLARMSVETTQLVSLTVTEKGYCLTADGVLDEALPSIINDLSNTNEPSSAIGLLVAALNLRFKANVPSFNVIACDNLPNNGEKLMSAVLQFAEKVSSELAEWISKNTKFPNTMVDCITPKTEHETIDLVQSKLGVIDNAPVQREHFAQWVIEDCAMERPVWEKVGVIFTDNVEVFENAKLRVLNGLHSALAYIGPLNGYDTVFEAISDKHIKSFLIHLVDNEIIPTLETVKGLDLYQYSRDIIARFENPKIKHLLRQIACDGSIKIPVRTLAPLANNLLHGRSIESLSVVVATWIHFLRDSVINQIEINDPLAKELAAAIKEHSQSGQLNVIGFLSLPGLIPEELRANPMFLNSIESAYRKDNALFGHNK